MNGITLRRIGLGAVAVVVATISGLQPVTPGLATAETSPANREFVRVAELIRERVPVRALVASRYGFDDARVDALAENASVAMSADGEIVFVDGPVPPPPPPPSGGPNLASALDAPRIGQSIPPSSQAFFLHSKPTAAKTLFLDFDGTPVGTWANAAQPPGSAVIGFDVDGQPTTYTPAELTFIRDTWMAVAEDFSTFDIDVTTEQPPIARLQRASATDNEFGTSIAISNNNFLCPGTCGGIAGLSVFSNFPGYSPGGWAFSATYFTRYPDGSIVPGSPAILSDVISHEAGHTLGLLHDGRYIDKTANPPTYDEYYQGHGSWLPIMGATNWYKTSQWSKGEYTNANRQEDDIAIIANTTGYSADDVGDTIATATVLGPGNVVVDQGLINSDADVDVYQFTTSPYGIYFRIQVVPNATSPDLDARFELRMADGTFAGSNDPPGTAAPIMNGAFPPGPNTYYIVVSGEPYLGPLAGWSGYGSVGQYELRVERLFAPTPPQNPSFVGYAPSVSISWSPSMFPGGAPVSYTAKLCLYPAVTTCTSATVGSATSASFPNTTPGLSYVGSVTANNGFADSPPATLPVTVLNLPPDPPTLQPISGDENPLSLTLTWTEGDLHGNVVTGYDVEVTNLSTGVTTTSVGSSPFVLTGVVSGHRYAMRVRTKAGPGPGDWSPPRYAIVPGRVDAPQVPTSSTVVPPTRPPAPQTPTSSTVPGTPPATRGPAPQA
jgi:hypothetical protein